jgi:hypothetical protein
MSRLLWITVALLLSVGAASAQVPIIIRTFPPLVPNVLVPIDQIFDYNVINPPVTLLGNVSLIWGPTDNTGLISAPVPGIPSFFYATAYRNNFGWNHLQDTTCVPGGTNPEWDWFLCRHPTWVRYKSDQITPAFEAGDTAYVPLNFANPDVVAFQETGAGSGGATGNLLGAFTGTFAGGAAYVGVALDNVNYENSFASSGYFAGTPNLALCTEASPSCGGTLTWVPQFPASDTGGSSCFPPITITGGGACWQAVSNPYLSQLHQWVGSQNKLAWCNVQKPSSSVVTATVAVARSCSNIVLLEDYMMDGSVDGACSGGNPHTPLYTPFADWPGLLQYVQALSGSVAISDVDYLCPGDNASNALPAQVSWGVANFLLIRNSLSYYSVKDEAMASFAAYPSYFFPSCGTAAWSQLPTILAGLNSGNSYERILNVSGSDPVGSKVCYVEVNPHDAVSGITSTYVLPSGTWVDQFGNVLSPGTNTLQPATGIVAVKTG